MRTDEPEPGAADELPPLTTVEWPDPIEAAARWLGVSDPAAPRAVLFDRTRIFLAEWTTWEPAQLDLEVSKLVAAELLIRRGSDG